MNTRTTLFTAVLPAALLVTLVLSSCGGDANTRTDSAAARPAGPGSFLNVSDIHFNPFYDSSLVPKLVAADVAEWESIFESSGDTTLSTYAGGGQDTDYPLLKSALAAMKRSAPNPDMIVIPGDFLAHDFETYFYGLSGVDQSTDSAAGYPALHGFIDKTMRFIAMRIDEEWPSVPVIAALGNNDSYCGDYMIQPKSPFLTMLAGVWKPMLRTANTGTFDATFPSGGYYSIPSPADSNVTIVVLNTVFMSRNFNKRLPCYCTPGDFGPGNAGPGTEELAWLTEQLKSARDAGKKVWLVQHITAGMDTYESLQGRPGYDFTPAFNDEYLAVIRANTDVIAANIAGHYHMDDFRLIRDSAGAAQTYVHLVPSISPINGNNPGFELVSFDRKSGVLLDYNAVYTSVATSPGYDQAKWDTEYRFSDLYGEKAITAETLDRVYDRLETDTVLQNRYMLYYPVSNTGAYDEYRAQFKEFWCSIGNMTLAGYEACCCE